MAQPIAREVASVLSVNHGGLLTISAVLALYFSSSGVESLRIGLNRAYNVTEARPWWLLRLELIAYVIIGAVALSTLAFLLVLAPLAFQWARPYAPWLQDVEGLFTFARFGIASVVLIVALVLVHKWLPYRAAAVRRDRARHPGHARPLDRDRRRLRPLSRGILRRYIATYAGLASAMVALVFLYWSAGIFVYGGELNQIIRRALK